MANPQKIKQRGLSSFVIIFMDWSERFEVLFVLDFLPAGLTDLRQSGRFGFLPFGRQGFASWQNEHTSYTKYY